MGQYDSDEYNRHKTEEGRAKRRERLAAARAKATRTQAEWLALVALFNGVCVRCVARGHDCEYVYRVKDHIVPLYQGGSDGIENLQPLCPLCNGQKASESIDHRPAAAAALGITWPLKESV